MFSEGIKTVQQKYEHCSVNIHLQQGTSDDPLPAMSSDEALYRSTWTFRLCEDVLVGWDEIGMKSSKSGSCRDGCETGGVLILFRISYWI
jgi:hypothetical protein